MVTINVELNSKSAKDGRYAIMLRFTKKKKLKRKSLGIFVQIQDFNPKAKYGYWIRKSCNGYQGLNSKIKIKIEEYNAGINEIERFDDTLPIKKLIERVENINIDLIKFMKKVINRYEDEERYCTSKIIKSVIFNIEKFLNGDILYFSQFNERFLYDLQSFFIHRKISQNSRYLYFKKLHTVIKIAIDEGMLPPHKNPFNKFDLKQKKVQKVKLTLEEIQKIKDLDLLPESKIWHARNMFLFSFYMAGMRFFDVILCKHNQIRENRFNYTMRKTKQNMSIQLNIHAKTIIDLYQKKESEYIFPFLVKGVHDVSEEILHKKRSCIGATTNVNLKKIAKKAGIEKNISFHIARHSFANIGRLKTNNDVYAICAALGHHSVSMTEEYLEDLQDDELDATMNQIFGE